MICLLRNLADIDVFDSQPQINYKIDSSIGTAISTIKFYRNKLSHMDNGSVSDLTFNEIFDAVNMVCIF